MCLWSSPGGHQYSRQGLHGGSGQETGGGDQGKPSLPMARKRRELSRGEEIGGPSEEETTRPPTLPPPGSSQNSELALLAYQNQQHEANYMEEERVAEEARL